jgi:phosphoglycolate phosphatase-like HAD superfamily hydrolase
MTVLFWDIDGTLLTTARGGMFAWDDGVKEITGRDFQLASLRVPGLTDYQIAAKTCELLGLEPSPPLVEQLVRRYESLLPTSLPRRTGHVLKNVREILEQLRGRTDVQSFLLTGNTRGGATAKLTHYGLIDFFAEGAFAEDTRARATIAQRALELARRAGPVSEQDMFVIGDTPHDIECARAIGVRTIAVATGGYSVEELREHDPWQLFEELPPPEKFLRLVGIDRSASADASARPARGNERAPA